MWGRIIFHTLAIYALLFIPMSASALDWTQPILDENNRPITDWLSCGIAAPTKDDKCGVVLTVGILTARALLSPSADPRAQESADQKALAGHLGLEILLHPDMTPTPDQLKMAKDAIGKLPSPLAVARAWDILDKAVK